MQHRPAHRRDLADFGGLAVDGDGAALRKAQRIVHQHAVLRVYAVRNPIQLIGYDRFAGLPDIGVRRVAFVIHRLDR